MFQIPLVISHVHWHYVDTGCVCSASVMVKGPWRFWCCGLLETDIVATLSVRMPVFGFLATCAICWVPPPGKGLSKASLNSVKSWVVHQYWGMVINPIIIGIIRIRRISTMGGWSHPIYIYNYIYIYLFHFMMYLYTTKLDHTMAVGWISSTTTGATERFC